MVLSGIFALLGNVFFLPSYVANKSGFPRPRDPERQQQLIERMLKGDKRARDALIAHNMRLVVHIVKTFSGYTANDELLSVCSI